MNISKVCWCQQQFSAYIERRTSAQETSWRSTHTGSLSRVTLLSDQVRAIPLWLPGIMIGKRTFLLVATCCSTYLWLASAEDSSLETRSSDFTLKSQQEKDLVRLFGWEMIGKVPSSHSALSCSIFEMASEEPKDQIGENIPVCVKCWWLFFFFFFFFCRLTRYRRF